MNRHAIQEEANCGTKLDKVAESISTAGCCASHGNDPKLPALRRASVNWLVSLNQNIFLNMHFYYFNCYCGMFVVSNAIIIIKEEGEEYVLNSGAA